MPSPCTASRPAGFLTFRYANLGCAQGRPPGPGVVGTFDSLNPLIVGPRPAQIRGYVIESLMARGYDEPFTLYGLLARGRNRRRAELRTFNLNPAAKFSDGEPVTAEDVLFSWQLLRDKGRPNYRTYYSKVARAEALSSAPCASIRRRRRPRTAAHPGPDAGAGQARDRPRDVRGDDARAVIGSGPYVVADVSPGKSVT